MLSHWQKPKVIYSSHLDFLKQDKKRQLQQEKEEIKRRKELEREEKEQIQLNQQREQEHLQKLHDDWISFHNGKGFLEEMTFIWAYDHEFFVIPTNASRDNKYNYIYSCPDYLDGKDLIKPFYGTYQDYFKGNNGRNKGSHIVRIYVGSKTKFDPQPYNNQIPYRSRWQ